MPSVHRPSPGRRIAFWVSGAKRFLLLGLLWLALGGTAWSSIVMGVVVCVIATALSLRLLPVRTPIRWSGLVRALPGFLWHSVIGGVDVARRAFDPRLPVRPGWVAVSVPLSGESQVVLGGELSLMPGSLVAGSDHDQLLIHLLDTNQDVLALIARETERLAMARLLAPGVSDPEVPR